MNHWENVRQARLLPNLSEINLSDLPFNGASAFILKSRTRDDIRFIKTGSKITEIIGFELRTTPAYSIIERQDRDNYTTLLSDAIAGPKVLDLRLDHDARMTLLPLADDNDPDLRHMLGCLKTNNATHEYPMRFRVKNVISSQLVLHKYIPPERMLQMAEAQPHL